MSDVTAILLAAGHGTRMRSNLIKVMHPIAGKPMIGHAVDNAYQAGLTDIVVVVGFQQERLRVFLGDRVKYAIQAEQLGTGHALLQAELFIDARQGGHVLVMLGDNPFLGPELITRLLNRHAETGASATLLTAQVGDPTGLGRVLRDCRTQRLVRIMEEKDATPEQRAVREIWTGVVVFRREGLTDLLKRLDRNNAQREYILPQTVELLVRGGEVVEAAMEATEEEALAPNNRVQLSEAEARIRRRILERHMLGGVTIIDPLSTFVDEGVVIGQDTTIWPFTILQGQTKIGKNCTIGPHATLVSSTIGDRSTIDQSVLEESSVGEDCRIGRFVHLQPGCILDDGAEVGSRAVLAGAHLGRGAVYRQQLNAEPIQT